MLRTGEEAQKENQAINKRNDAAFDALPDLAQINLKRIKFSRDTSQHDGIDPNKIYLVSNGRWALGKFYEMWYGWNFSGLYDAGCQLNGLDIIYETDLAEAPKQAEEYVSGNVYEPCNDSDRQMYMEQDGIPAFGYGKAPCEHCGRDLEEHDGEEKACRPGSEW